MAKKITNKHRVRKSVWDRWSERARGVFNEMMARTRGNNQKFYLHPKVKPVADAYWTTTCWNMAWEAAEIVSGEQAPKAIVIQQKFEGSGSSERVARAFVKTLEKTKKRGK